MRWNWLCVAGLVISGLSVAFWIMLFLASFAISPGQTDSDESFRMYYRALLLLYILGVCVSFFTPLGSFLQMPGLVFVSALVWMWSVPSTGIYVDMAVSIVGTGLIFASMFVQLSPFEPSGEVKALPRFRTWILGPEPENARVRFFVPRMPKIAKVLLLTLLSACIVIVAVTFLHLTDRPVSTIDIEVVADVYTYGQVHITVYIDDVKVIDRHLEPDSSTNESHRLAFIFESWNVTAGEHIVAAHYTNSTSGVLDDDPEYVTELRILPFSAREVRIGIGVGWV